MSKVRDYVSFSELKMWHECSWRHNLKYVEDIDLDEESVHTSFGTALHHFAENHVKGIDATESAIDMLKASWKENEFEDEGEWITFARGIMADLPSFLDTEFPGWTLVDAELELNEEIPGSTRKFKGYIDLVISKKNKKGKDELIVIDWKTTKSSGWHYMKKRDPLVLMQLVLYKHFLSEKMSIPIKSVKCGFVILKRGAPVGKSCEYLNVSAGPVTIDRVKKKITQLVKNVENERKIKNRLSCKYCRFKNTEHCKGFVPPFTGY